MRSRQKCRVKLPPVRPFSGAGNSKCRAQAGVINVCGDLENVMGNGDTRTGAGLRGVAPSASDVTLREGEPPDGFWVSKLGVAGHVKPPTFSDFVDLPAWVHCKRACPPPTRRSSRLGPALVHLLSLHYRLYAAPPPPPLA